MGAGSFRSMPNPHIHKFIAYGHKNVAIVHKSMDMAERLKHAVASSIISLGTDASLCTLYLFFYSHKAAAFLSPFIAMEFIAVYRHLLLWYFPYAINLSPIELYCYRIHGYLLVWKTL